MADWEEKHFHKQIFRPAPGKGRGRNERNSNNFMAHYAQ